MLQIKEILVSPNGKKDSASGKQSPYKKCSGLFDRLGSGDDVDAGEFGRDLVDQALEEIRHGSVHDCQNSSADDHDDQDLHGYVQEAFTGLVFEETVEDRFCFHHVLSFSFEFQ